MRLLDCVLSLLLLLPGEGDPEGVPAYQLRPGDRIEIRVYRHEDLTLSFTVPEEGWITYPVLGRLPVAGRSALELERAIADGLSSGELILDPQVTVLVKERTPEKLYVLDGVRRPAEYEIPPGRPLRLTQALALAGGFLPNADPRRVTILRAKPDGGRYVMKVDVKRIVEDGMIEDDPVMRPDDTIVVAVDDPEASRVFVAGRVRNGGAYRFDREEGMTVFRAIILAGGFDKYADTASTFVIRKASGERSVVRVDMAALLKGDLAKDLELEAGDIVVVPESFW